MKIEVLDWPTLTKQKFQTYHDRKLERKQHMVSKFITSFIIGYSRFCIEIAEQQGDEIKIKTTYSTDQSVKLFLDFLYEVRAYSFMQTDTIQGNIVRTLVINRFKTEQIIEILGEFFENGIMGFVPRQAKIEAKHDLYHKIAYALLKFRYVKTLYEKDNVLIFNED